MNTTLFRQLDRANLFSLVGLLLSFMVAIFAIEGYYYASILCILYTGCVDVFDGVIARLSTRTAAQSALGKHLDSMIDVCSFGFAPVIFGYCFGLRSWVSVLILALYLLSSVARVAYHESAGYQRIAGTDHFIGLPVTFAALFFPNLFLFNFFVSKQAMMAVLTVTYLGMAIAMVGGFLLPGKNPKPQRTPRRYTLLPLGALILTIVYGYAIIR